MGSKSNHSSPVYIKAACPVCKKNASFKKLVELEKHTYFPKRKFGYLYCTKCEVAFLNPFLVQADLQKIYHGEYYRPFDEVKESKFLDFLLKTKLTSYEDFVGRWQKPGKILDVGCGRGEFLSAMQKRRWSVYGIEPYNKAVVISRKKVGSKRIFKGELKKIKLPYKDFDVITLWHVFEHLIDPVGYLITIRKHLRRGGKLIMEFPNLDSLIFAIFGQHYNMLVHNEHVMYYSIRGTKKLLSNNGFKIQYIYSPMKINSSFAINTANFIKDKFPLKNRAEILWKFIVLVLLPFSFLLSLISSFIKKGEAIRVVAEKL